MSTSTLYDDDILLWSEQQAEVIRAMARTSRNLPNELDIENVAEEIESVGRSELASVESYIDLILLHLIKLTVMPEGEAANHWRSEIVGFHGNMMRRYAPSMRQRIDFGKLWWLAREQIILASADAAEPPSLPESCPLHLADLLAPRIDAVALIAQISRATSEAARSPVIG